jgi:hypothetical protein
MRCTPWLELAAPCLSHLSIFEVGFEMGGLLDTGFREYKYIFLRSTFVLLTRSIQSHETTDG